MDDSLSSPVRDPFDFSESSYPNSISLSTSQKDDTESSTYGKLVNEIYKCGSRTLRYHEDYLKTHSSAPPEEDPQYEFVSKGDFLCAGRDFTVFAGHLFKDYNASPSLLQKERSKRDFGDHKFVKPSGGTTAGSASYMSAGPKPVRVAVALKESVQSIHQSGNRPFVLGTFLKEIRVMGEMKSCANIVDLFGVAFVEAGQEVKPTLVVELAFGSLVDWFHTNLSSTVTWALKLLFASHISAALCTLHARGIVHADVKGQNVLVFPHESTQFCAKLSDFGNSITTGAKSPIAAGTKYWLAPECLNLDGADPGRYGNSEYRDIYAFGLLLWELATSCGRSPFSDALSDDEVLRMKFSDDGEAAKYLLARVPDDTPQCLQEIIRDTLRADPTQRTPLSTAADRLQKEVEQISSAVPPVPDNDTSSQSQSSRGETDTTAEEEALLKIPWSLQKRVHEESMQSSSRDIDSKVFLAYCYVLCSDRNLELREDALRLLRQTARLDPFHLAPGAKLTPFRAMMELQDWEGLSEILPESEAGITPVLDDQRLHHIYSFGWRRFIVLACAAGAESSWDSATADTLRFSSESVAVASVQLIANTGVPDVGQASWGTDGLSALHMASVSGKSRAVSALLANGADATARDKASRTPLHLCCQSTSLSDDLSLEVARSFCRHRPDSDSVNDVMEHTLYTPLRFAVEAEKPRLCQFLLQNGADVNACAAEGSTALQECAWVAGEKGNGRVEGGKDKEKAVELAKVLLTYGKVDINMRSCHNSVTALGIAAAHGNFLQMVSLLLDYDADPNTSVDSLTALSAAVQHKNREMVSVLLDRGADPNFSVRNVTPLGLAVILDQHDIAPILLEHGADPNTLERGIPLVGLAILNHLRDQADQDEICPNLTILLQHGASVTATAHPLKDLEGPPPGCAPVHFAAYKGSAAALNVLLDHEASLSARTEDKETVLHIVVSTIEEDSGRVRAILEELICRGIDRDAINVFGETALHLASKYHRDDIRAYLLEMGCNPDIENVSGRTAQQLYNLDEEALRNEEYAMHEALRQRRQRQEESPPPPLPLPGTGDRESSGEQAPSGHYESEEREDNPSSDSQKVTDNTGGTGKHSTPGHSVWGLPLLAGLTCTLLILGVAAYTRSLRVRQVIDMKA